MGARAGALAAHEVAVGGRDTALARRHPLAVRREAHRAARLAPLEARVEEHLVEAFGLGLLLDALGPRHDPRRHVIGLVPAPGDLSRGTQVGDAAVGAGADEHPVDLGALDRLAGLESLVLQRRFPRRALVFGTL